jgi:transcriptional regulator of aromatic amino acid metabolism
MERYFHAEILEQKRQKELQERNLNAKRRLQEIASGNQTQWSGNIKDLKNVTKVAESILNSKDLQKEYEDMLNTFNVINVKTLNMIRDDILRKYDNDPYFVRLFTKYSELLSTEVKKSTLQSVEKKKQTPVTFYNGK